MACRDEIKMGSVTTSAASDRVGGTLTRSPQSSSKRRHEQRKRQNRKALLGSLKRFCIYVSAGTAIASSVFVIYSCKFFSYRDIANYKFNVVDDDEFRTRAITSSIEYGDTGTKEPEYVESLSYSPFEDLSEAGVGLFSYFVGDSSAAGAFTADEMCFRYDDEVTEYNLFTSNHQKADGSTHGRNIDLWIAARYCSILAPVVAFLAFAQLLLERFCGCRLARCGSFVNNLLFLMAGVLQFGTFVVAFASPTLLSDDSPGEGEERFCFSAESRFQCRIDTGAWFSLGSAIAYMTLAVSSATFRTTRHNAHNDGENEDSKKNREYCGGCCIVGKPFRDRQIESSSSNVSKKRQTNRQRRWARESGDTSFESTFSSDDGIHDNNGHLGSSSSRDRQARSVRYGSNLTKGSSSSIDREQDRNKGDSEGMKKKDDDDENEDDQGCDGDLTNNNGDNNHTEHLETGSIPMTPCDADGTSKDFQQNDDADSIKEVTSIETDFVRPGAACCYCSEINAQPPLQQRQVEKEKTAQKRIIIRNNNMESMLSEDDELDEETNFFVENTAGYEETTTVEECEARFMAELEGSQMEHSNWENSQWKKGFDFVRS